MTRERVLSTPLQRARGVIGRYPERDERYVFKFDRAAQRTVHMVGVRKPLRVTWLVGGVETASDVLRPWVGWGRHRADEIWEAVP